jgi:hypothetical protein
MTTYHKTVNLLVFVLKVHILIFLVAQQIFIEYFQLLGTAMGIQKKRQDLQL